MSPRLRLVEGGDLAAARERSRRIQRLRLETAKLIAMRGKTSEQAAKVAALEAELGVSSSSPMPEAG